MSEKVEMTVSPTSFVLNAGGTAEIVAGLRNLGQSVDQFTLSVEMLDKDWYTLPVSGVALFPNDQDNLKIILHPPKSIETKPGSYPFRIKVVSQDAPDEATTADLNLEIRGLQGFEISLSPERIVGWRGTYNIRLDNPNNVESTLYLAAGDAKGLLRYNILPAALNIPGAGYAEATLKAGLGWKALLSVEREFRFQVQAAMPGAEQVVTARGQLVPIPFDVRVPSVSRIWAPLLKRPPMIRSFEATTDDNREFRLAWLVKRSKEVRLNDEEVESKGEKIIRPAEATTYKLTVSNKHGTVTESVDVHPVPMPQSKVSDKIKASLSTVGIEASAGGMPVQTTLDLQNLGEIVDKLLLVVEGVDESWYSLSASSVALMPQATGQVIISFQLPKKQGVKTGTYPFAVSVRSESRPEDEACVVGTLEVLPSLEYKLAVRPYRVTTRRKAKFRVNLTNTSVSNVAISLDATDLDEGLKFHFKDEAPVVPAWKTIEVPVYFKPKKGGTIGEHRRFDITITSTATDTGDSQTVNCELHYRPMLGSWKTIFRVIRIIIFIGIIGAVIGFAIHWGGGLNLLRRSPTTWWDTLLNQITRTFSSWLTR